ncbi:MAG: META domain-containing protein [Sphingomicrobium sp.]
MRMTLGLAPLLLGLAACQTYPADPYGNPGYPPPPYPAPYPGPYPAPYPGPPAPQGDYRAIGTEPFWDLNIGRDMRFTDRGNNLSVVEPTPPVINGIAGEIYNGRRLKVNIVHRPCSDGMSDRTYRDTVQVTVDGRPYRGCGAPAAFFTTVDERGNPQVIAPQAGPETTLERTRWRVTRINGRPVPRQGDYHLDFQSGQIAAKFGCNSIGGSYSQTGTTLDAGAMIGTQMACGNMSFETQAQAILAQLMTIQVMGLNRLTLSNARGTIDLMRR